jgi:glycosyltransferase involved in cell wall biosynthesis
VTPITLLIPCYNAARFLPRLLESVRAQTVPFADILCYDDGSRDETVAVARELGLNIITGQPNRGVAHARNALAAAAPTEWFHFHDADDMLAPRFVERLGPWCDNLHDVVSCDADWIDDQTRALVVPWRYDAAALARAPLAHLLQRAMGTNSTVIRASRWRAIGGCDESLAIWEDADVHIRLARAGARFHHVPEVLTYSLRRGESFSHDYRRNWLCRLQALEGYAANPDASAVREVLSAETERAAGELALLGERPSAERALTLCRRLGGNPPSSGHPIVRILKPFVPAYTLVRWQALRRNPGAARNP